MAASGAPPKLFAVTIRRSIIGRPWWIKRTVDALGFRRRNQTIVCKNTPSINGQLRQIKDMIEIKPVVLRTDIENSPNGDEILLDNGHFFVSKSTLDELNKDIMERVIT